DLARPRVVEEHRAEQGAVVEEEAPEDGVGGGARAQPLRPLERPAPVAHGAGDPGGEPAHAGPEATRPVAVGRRRPVTLRVGEVGERALELCRRLVHTPDHQLERVLKDVRYRRGKRNTEGATLRTGSQIFDLKGGRPRA